MGPLVAKAAALRGSDPFRELESNLGRAAGLPIPAAAWVLEMLVETRGAPGLVVVPREAEALAWVEAASWFGGRPVAFPTPPLTPYQQTSIPAPVRAEEVRAIDRIVERNATVVVATPRGLASPLPRAEEFAKQVLQVATGAELELERAIAWLQRAGYERTDLVTQLGEFAVRGGVLDLFGPGASEPVRVDLLGDEVDSLHRFDPVDQRSTLELSECRVLPMAIFPSGPGEAQRLGAQLLRAAHGELSAEGEARLADLTEGRSFPGWERLLPALAERASTLHELVAPELVAVHDPETVQADLEHYVAECHEDFQRRLERGLAVPAPDALTVPLESVLRSVEDAELCLESGTTSAEIDFGGSWTDSLEGQLPRFAREVSLAQERGERVLLVAPAEQHAGLEDWLESQGLESPAVQLAAGELARGFRLPAAQLVVFSVGQLFPNRTSVHRPQRGRQALVAGMRDLRVGDFVVHRDHGIGQFVALRSLSGGDDDTATLPPTLREVDAERSDREEEVMEIAYAGGRTLLVPLQRLDLVERYGGLEGARPRLDKLGGSSWNKTRERVRVGVRKLATDLLKLYAERRLAEAPVFEGASDLEGQFVAAFPYEETRDQLAAIEEIRSDLASGRPMDRLVCGDVGFGKTEVAMRAAFQAVENNYQVAVLAPTTILADQHLDTFRRRFAGLPVTVDMVSRFRSDAEIAEVRSRLEMGEVDILVGTHRLLTGDLVFPNLGLLVVDEEQRFGVAQKEQLRELKKSVHVLSMSATPVPRTLQLSMAGVRDLSVIESPPRDRMAVETAVLPLSGDVVREAVEFERDRGGQTYFVHNRVEDIEEMAHWLRELVPGLSLTVGHGQLDEKELARRMHAFKRGDFELLLATTIIENGIDIPNVNTMLVHRADRFGLSQIYQLRGRVGRGTRLAYCYLLVSPDRVLTPEARERLEAVREFTELGSGFRVAARDLEIRGAGDLLGAEQSGHIVAVGMETYLRMLEEAVRELRGEQVATPGSVVLDLPVVVTIPKEYIPDESVRMETYRRVGRLEAAEDELMAELTDRFGPPPQSVRDLIAVAQLKRDAETIGVQSISFKRSRLQMRLRQDTTVDVERLVRWIGERESATFSPGGVLSVGGLTVRDAVPVARTVLGELAPGAFAESATQPS